MKEEDRENKFQNTVHGVCVCVCVCVCIDLGWTDNLAALRNSLAVQWLGLCTSAAVGLSSISGSITKILQAAQGGSKKGDGRVLP